MPPENPDLVGTLHFTLPYFRRAPNKTPESLTSFDVTQVFLLTIFDANANGLETVNGEDLKSRTRLRVIIVTVLFVIVGLFPALAKILRE